MPKWILYTEFLVCIIIQTELSYITRKTLMEISCLRKMKLFQYPDLQATMKLCHKKWRVLLFIPSGLQKELKVLLKATVWITSAVCFNPECPVPRGPAQEGGNSSPSPSGQRKSTRRGTVATGQRLGVSPRSSNGECQCAQDCSPSCQPVMGPHSPPWK